MSIKCVGVIVNPNAGGGISSRKYRELIEYLERYGISFMHAYLANPLDTDSILENFFKENFDMVMILGGDGTLNHVGQHLVGRDLPLLVIPFGSGNDFYSSHWGQKRLNLKAIVKRIVRGDYRFKRVDVGLVEGKRYRRYFFNSFGIGIAGSVARGANRVGKKKGFSTFFFNALKDVLFGSRPFEADIYHGEHRFSGKLLTLHVGINRREGGGFNTFPLADPTDGLLDLVYLRSDRIGKLSLLSKLHKVKVGKHLDDKDVIYVQVPEFTIGLRERAVAHVDGEDFDMMEGEYVIKNVSGGIVIVMF